MGIFLSKPPEIKTCIYCNKPLKIIPINTGVSSVFVYSYKLCECRSANLERTLLNTGKQFGLNS